MDSVRKLAAANGYGAMLATMSDAQIVTLARRMLGYRGPEDTKRRVLAVARTTASSMGVDIDEVLTDDDKDRLWKLLVESHHGYAV